MRALIHCQCEYASIEMSEVKRILGSADLD